MRRLLMVALMLCVAGTAMAAVTTTNVGTIDGKFTVTPPAAPGVRVQGDEIVDPFIATLGTFTGSTATFTHNYDEICPYSGSLAPDVVYAYTATGAVASLNLDLCYSSYDTKLFVYQDAWTPGAPWACNDDFNMSAPCYTYSSKIIGMPVTAGHVYYIVVDGYGSQSGSYQLDITDGGIVPPSGACCAVSGACSITQELMCVGVWQGEGTICSPNPCPPPPPIDCPTGALIEGEPAIGDNYIDNYNGGCNSTPVIWQTLNPQAGGCAVMCGKSCTYLNQGASTRDTDWYLACATQGTTVSQTVGAEFPYMMALFTGTDCAGMVYSYYIGAAGETYTLVAVATSDNVGFFVANSGFSGWPTELGYVMTACGIIECPPPPGACCNTAGLCIIASVENCAFMGGNFIGGPCLPTTCDVIPTETKSWGAVKNLYR